MVTGACKGPRFIYFFIITVTSLTYWFDLRLPLWSLQWKRQKRLRESHRDDCSSFQQQVSSLSVMPFRFFLNHVEGILNGFCFWYTCGTLVWVRVSKEGTTTVHRYRLKLQCHNRKWSRGFFFCFSAMSPQPSKTKIRRLICIAVPVSVCKFFIQDNQPT